MKQDEQGKHKHQNGTKAPIPHSLYFRKIGNFILSSYLAPLSHLPLPRAPLTQREERLRGRVGSGLCWLCVDEIYSLYTDKKENQIFLTYKEIQNGAVAKSYMNNGLLIMEKIFAHILIY